MKTCVSASVVKSINRGWFRCIFIASVNKSFHEQKNTPISPECSSALVARTRRIRSVFKARAWRMTEGGERGECGLRVG